MDVLERTSVDISNILTIKIRSQLDTDMLEITLVDTSSMDIIKMEHSRVSARRMPVSSMETVVIICVQVSSRLMVSLAAMVVNFQHTVVLKDIFQDQIDAEMGLMVIINHEHEHEHEQEQHTDEEQKLEWAVVI